MFSEDLGGVDPVLKIHYLDDAYLAHLPKVRIIHGRGTGALKSAVQTMLRRNKHVAKYRPGEFDEGGYGVTIAEFK